MTPMTHLSVEAPRRRPALACHHRPDLGPWRKLTLILPVVSPNLRAVNYLTGVNPTLHSMTSQRNPSGIETRVRITCLEQKTLCLASLPYPPFGGVGSPTLTFTHAVYLLCFIAFVL